MIESPVERLTKTHPDMEIWWDSSPLVYNQWVRKMLNSGEPSRRLILEEQLARLYDTESPYRVFSGDVPPIHPCECTIVYN